MQGSFVLASDFATAVGGGLDAVGIKAGHLFEVAAQADLVHLRGSGECALGGKGQKIELSCEGVGEVDRVPGEHSIVDEGLAGYDGQIIHLNCLAGVCVVDGGGTGGAAGHKRVVAAGVIGQPDRDPARLARHQNVTLAGTIVAFMDGATGQRADEEGAAASGDDPFGVEPIGQIDQPGKA